MTPGHEPKVVRLGDIMSPQELTRFVRAHVRGLDPRLDEPLVSQYDDDLDVIDITGRDGPITWDDEFGPERYELDE